MRAFLRPSTFTTPRRLPLYRHHTFLSSMATQRVLIVGAGVAGSILAHTLAEAAFDVTVIERSPVEQKLGQGIEIEEPALQVIRHMGLLETLQAIKTGETGFSLVDAAGRSRARFGVGDSVGFTGNLELMRGDLTHQLYLAANKFPNVRYEFETTVQSITESEKHATAVLLHRATQASTTADFDYIVGADGTNSKTRRLVFGAPEDINCFAPVGAYVAFFSIPRTDADWPVSRACHFPGRRVAWIRPQQAGSPHVSAHFISVGPNAQLEAANASGDRQQQKAAWTALFHDCGWDVPRALAAMQDAGNFYSDTLRQVQLPRWSKGRAALVGDAAWAPTPFTGQGNQLAIMGAWVLGQELGRHRSPAAFDAYEARLRSYVLDSQQIPLGGRAKHLFCPDKAWSIFVLRSVLFGISVGVRFFLWTGLDRLLSRIFTHQEDGFDMQMPEKRLDDFQKK